MRSFCSHKDDETYKYQENSRELSFEEIILPSPLSDASYILIYILLGFQLYLHLPLFVHFCVRQRKRDLSYLLNSNVSLVNLYNSIKIRLWVLTINLVPCLATSIHIWNYSWSFRSKSICHTISKSTINFRVSSRKRIKNGNNSLM